MKSIAFQLVIIIFITACYSSPRYVKLADHAISSFSDEIYYTDELQLVGSGGSLLEDIKKFNLVYVSHQQLNLIETRKLFVNTVERFLYKINNDPEIRPFLHNYPVSIKNLHLSISFYNEHDRVQSTFIALASVPNINPNEPTDRIYYSIYDQKNETLVTVYDESYQEALTKVRSY